MKINYMNLNDSPFNLIKNKIKTIEMRLNDERRKELEIGDLIEFTNNINKEKLYVKILNLYYYPSFKQLYEHFDKKSLGYLEHEEKNYLDMEQYYSIDKINKYGVVGIEISLISKIQYLEYCSKINSNKRIENTMNILENFANENMSEKEKEDFLSNLGKK